MGCVTDQLVYPFVWTGREGLTYMLDAKIAGWQCSSADDCGMCDACGMAKEWEDFEKENKALHDAVLNLQWAWDECLRQAKKEDRRTAAKDREESE